jgi:hypothetical protein
MIDLDTESDLYLLVGGQYKGMMCAPRIAISMPSKRDDACSTNDSTGSGMAHPDI